MTESATIERKTVALPNAPRTLTTKHGIRVFSPGKYVTDARLCVLVDVCAVEKEKYFVAEERQRILSPDQMDSRIADMMHALPVGETLEIVPELALVDADGEVTDVIFRGLVEDLTFPIRSYLWITGKLKLRICHRADVATGPFPIRNSDGDTVGLIMPGILDNVLHLGTIANIA